MPKLVLITGATSGIGEACAIKLAEEKNNLILTGRREERLHTLAGRLEKEYQIKVLPLVFDVRDRDETVSTLHGLEGKWRQVDVLINNAGLAKGLDYIHEGSFEHWDTMLDTNIGGLLNVTRTVVPWMVEQKSGHVINIGSVAGREVYPKGNVYCASKHAVAALSKAMRIDLLPHRIKVSHIAPGHVETEFAEVRYDGDKERAGELYQDFEPLSANDIAELVQFMVSRPSHVNIDDVLILCTQQASATLIDRSGKIN